MMTNAIIATLIACHPAAGNHFATFALELEQNGVHWQAAAAETAAEQFEKRGVAHDNFWREYKIRPIKSLSDSEALALAEKLVADYQGSTHVIVEVCDPFMVTVLAAFQRQAPQITRIAYYDNPEAYVPGGYTETAERIVKLADKVFFANSNLASTPMFGLREEQRIGLGYYPLDQVKELAKLRAAGMREQLRQTFFLDHKLNEPQSVNVYFGGANAVYYQSAFPAFLNMLTEACQTTDLSDQLIILQQHPRAKEDGSPDQAALEQWVQAAPPRAPAFIISNSDFATAVAIADRAFYFQTGASPQLIMLGIPTMQVGLKFEDLAVRSGLAPSITEGKALAEALLNAPPLPLTPEKLGLIYDLLGIKPNWIEILISTLNVSGQLEAAD